SVPVREPGEWAPRLRGDRCGPIRPELALPARRPRRREAFGLRIRDPEECAAMRELESLDGPCWRMDDRSVAHTPEATQQILHLHVGWKSGSNRPITPERRARPPHDPRGDPRRQPRGRADHV